jgi:hypothetical protein
MEAQYKTRNGNLTVKVTGETQKDIFRELARAQDVFECETECGLCQSAQIKFSVRTVDDNEYYTLRCACGAEFSFGQHKKGGSLFPKRKDEHGKPLPNRGWAKWEANNAAISHHP